MYKQLLLNYSHTTKIFVLVTLNMKILYTLSLCSDLSGYSSGYVSLALPALCSHESPAGFGQRSGLSRLWRLASPQEGGPQLPGQQMETVLVRPEEELPVLVQRPDGESQRGFTLGFSSASCGEFTALYSDVFNPLLFLVDCCWRAASVACRRRKQRGSSTCPASPSNRPNSAGRNSTTCLLSSP